MITLTILISVNDQNNSSCTCALGDMKSYGGGGEFSSRKNFFRYQISCMNFF